MKELTIERFPPLMYACNEAVNTLCTNLSFARADLRKILITSSRASEGKSFLSMNIARSLGNLGKNVIFVDADLRRSTIVSRYGITFNSDSKNEQGLAHYLAGLAEAGDIIYRTNVAGLFMVPVGREVLDSLPLLTSPRLKPFLDHLAEKFDYVIVDTPPVGQVIDAAEVARYCDGILISVKYNSLSRRELQEAKAQLEQSGCPILGAILNQVDYDTFIGKKYYYHSYYARRQADSYYYAPSSTKKKKSAQKNKK